MSTQLERAENVIKRVNQGAEHSVKMLADAKAKVGGSGDLLIQMGMLDDLVNSSTRADVAYALVQYLGSFEGGPVERVTKLQQQVIKEVIRSAGRGHSSSMQSNQLSNATHEHWVDALDLVTDGGYQLF